MSLKTTFIAAITAASFALPAFAEDITVKDPYARVSAMMSSSGAAFMVIENTGAADRLIGARSDVAEKTELHTHKEDDMGVMRMIHVEEGFELPAGGHIMMARGGHHVMFLGLNRPLQDGDEVQLTLEFEKAGDIAVTVPVDLQRKPDHGAMGQGAMGHATMGHGTMQKQSD